MAEGQRREARTALERAMEKVNWARVYHAYFQNMVVLGLTRFAYNAVGLDAGFAAVARVIESGSQRCFKTLKEELAKAGLSLPDEASLEQVLEYEVKCHSFAVEGMGVAFQVWEEYRREGNRHILYTKKCIYEEEVKRNPVVCAVCVGLTTGILKMFKIKAQWVREPTSGKRRLCILPPERRPEYVVYRDPNVKLPACALIVEKLECQSTQQS